MSLVSPALTGRGGNKKSEYEKKSAYIIQNIQKRGKGGKLKEFPEYSFSYTPLLGT